MKICIVTEQENLLNLILNLLGINNRLVFSLGELNETGNFRRYSCKICGKNIQFPNNLIKNGMNVKSMVLILYISINLLKE